ncbi:MAG: Nramp family divalent metal transporter [Candidatus Micrarchaeaceae archaeon]|jgi:NRAMP (natural resistance-associated macrophage protein)-like metal ion transporter|nr:divalent metal cation transporter [Candidatus Micrarchaeota archaeon]
MDLGIKRFLRKLGPGLITGASDDDPSGIATYSQAGAQFGLKTLWTALISTPLMISIQEMCARIGIVTRQGLTRVIRDNYPKPVLYAVMLISFTAVIFNIGADISAVGAVSNLLFPQIPTIAFCLVFTCLLALILIRFSYRKLSSLMKWLCLAFFAYFIVPFLVGQNWQYVITNLLIPTISLNKGFVLILVAILGTTISPYLFFWQASTEVEEREHSKSLVVNKKIMDDMEIDVDLGMLFSNVIMFFIILTTGTVLFNAHITQINTVDQAAQALRPLAGNAAYLLFALGIFGSAFIAIPVLAGSLSYMYAEALGTGVSLDRKFHEAKSFYMVLIVSLAVGLLMNLLGLSPIKMLIYSAVLYGLIAPILILIILHICNNRSILKRYVNGWLSNVFGIITFIVMAAVAILFLYLQFA